MIGLSLLAFSGTAGAQPKPNYDVSIMVDTIAPISRQLVGQLEREVRAVVGEDATINVDYDAVLSHEFDVERAESNYRRLLEDETDIILAFGAVSNLVLADREHYSKPTILFGNLNLDMVELDPNQATSQTENFTYLINSQSYREDLEVFHDLTEFRRVGVLVDGPDALVAMIRPVLDRTFSTLEADYELIRYRSVQSLAEYFEEIDALYIAEGFSIPAQEMAAITRLLLEAGIPSFTTTATEDVEAGLMATRQPRGGLEQFIRRLALTIEAVVNGESLADRPILFEAGPRLMVNYATALRTEVPITFSLLAIARIVGDFDDAPFDHTYSFPDLALEALQRNLDLAVSEIDVELAEQAVRSARSDYLPSLTSSWTGTHIDSRTARVSGGQSPEYSTQGSLDLQQILFSNSIRSNVAIQEELQDAQRAETEARRLDLVLEAATIYFNVLALKTDTQVRRQNMDLTRNNLEVAESNFAAGASGKRDLLRFRSELAANTQDFVDSVGRFEQGVQELNRLVDHPIDRRVNVEDASLDLGIFAEYNYRQVQQLLEDPASKEALVELLVARATDVSPELRALDHRRSVTELVIDLHGAKRYLPTVAGQARYLRNLDQWGVGAPPPGSTLDETYSVGISASVPIFDRNHHNTELRAALLERQQLDLRRQDLVRQVEQGVLAAVTQLATRIPNLELSRHAEETAEESLELSQAAYSAGALTIVELLDAQNNYFKANLAHANAHYSFLQSALQLERLVGHYFLLSPPEQNDRFMAPIRALQENQAEGQEVQ